MPLVLSLFFLINLVFAQEFNLIKHEVTFEIPYTFGKHKGELKELNGKLNLKSGGSLSTSITSLKTDNAKMDCHLYESLGLDYNKTEFPDRHVCVDDKLPEEGVNKIVFSQVSYAIRQITILEKTGEKIVIKIEGTWSIHGHSKEEQYQLTLNKHNSEWISEFNVKLSLSDFSIIVKKFLFIKVEDTVTLKLKLFWSQK